MGMFAQQEGIEKVKDQVGAPSRIWESAVHDVIIDMAYMGQADGGSHFIALTLKRPVDNALMDINVSITSGKEKGCSTTYEKNGKSYNLPGYNLAMQLCKFTANETFDTVHTAGKKGMVNIWDYDEKKEVPKERLILVDIIGKPVSVAIKKKTVNKKVFNTSIKKWEATAESKEKNDISYFFYPASKLTMIEIEEGVTEAETFEKWNKLHKGVTLDARTIKSDAAINMDKTSETVKIF